MPLQTNKYKLYLYLFFFIFLTSIFNFKILDNNQEKFSLKKIYIHGLSNNEKQIIGKLFSISANMPKFLKRFPEAKILYMVRDPLSVIPSGLSLVTGVLDKKFGFWNLPENKRNHYIPYLNSNFKSAYWLSSCCNFGNTSFWRFSF